MTDFYPQKNQGYLLVVNKFAKIGLDSTFLKRTVKALSGNVQFLVNHALEDCFEELGTETAVDFKYLFQEK